MKSVSVNIFAKMIYVPSFFITMSTFESYRLGVIQMSTFVIVGGGQAAGQACASLRQEKFEGDILLIGRLSFPSFWKELVFSTREVPGLTG